jgi:hypothetical protein
MQSGIYITRITPPASGWPIAMRCEECKRTVFMLSEFGIRPKDGDFFLVNMCADELMHNLSYPPKQFFFEATGYGSGQWDYR